MNKEEENYYKTEIFGRIFSLNNALQYYLDSILKDQNMTVKQMFTMLAIDHFEGGNPTLKDLSELLHSSHQNVKQLVNKLKKNGYVAVQTDPKDKRALRISLTKKATDYWREHDLDYTARLDLLFKGFTDDEFKGMLRGIEKLTNNIAVLEEK